MLDNHARSRVVGCAAILAGMMAIATGAAVAGENNASLAEKRGLSPIAFDYILKTCKETETGGDPRSAMRAVDPAGMFAIYLQNNNNRTVDDAMLSAIKITLLEDTKHGEVTSVVDNTGRYWYRYDPEPDYVGKDRAVFMAEFEGKRYKIVLELRVFTIVDENNPTCPEPKLIKVKKPSTGSSSHDLNSVTATFADLEGGAIGLTDASGIALDTNAAGYNWFIDTTSADNGEYLATVPAPKLMRGRTAGFHA
jgi:hypothetical protein